VDDFVVDADQHRAGKAVDDCRRRACARIGKHFRRDVVERGGGHASSNVLLQRIEREACDAADFAQPG